MELIILISLSKILWLILKEGSLNFLKRAESKLSVNVSFSCISVAVEKFVQINCC